MERDSGKDSKREEELGPGGVAGALGLLAALVERGLRTVILCPGGRNAPMLQALELVASPWKLEVHTFFDERAAGFFALGRAKRDEAPVLVSVTSGTALAELLPAAIEAHAGDTPLVIVSADRPRSHRGSGSPQSMRQVNLFGDYAPTLHDWQEGEALPDWLSTWSQRSPVHVNLCHDEPLWDKSASIPKDTPAPKIQKKSYGTITASFPKFKRPLVLVGALAPSERDAVAAFCRWYQAPVLAEASSGIREVSMPNQVLAADRVVRRWFKAEEFDGVIRFGATPSWRLWRDLENWKGSVVSFGQTQWPGLPGRTLSSGDLAPWLQRWMKEGPTTNLRGDFHQEDHLVSEKREALLARYPVSEAALVRKVSIHAPPNALMYLGNSRPVRDWNEHALQSKIFEIQENRGLNGIDGQASSFYGHARPQQENWALLGDLTLMYDMQAMWALRLLDPETHTRLVVMNNSGGQIFRRMFPSPLFLNSHPQSFEHLAHFWNLPYSRELNVDARHALIELIPDAGETEAFKDAWDKL